MAGTPSTPAGPKDLDATDLYPEYSLHPSEVLSTVQWFSDGFISKHENYIFKHRISTCVSIEPSSAFPDASPHPRPLCLLLADRTVPRLRPQGFRPLPVIPPAPWNCPASLGSPEPRGEGRARGQQLPDRWSRSPGRLSLGPFSLRVKPRHRISRLAGWLRYENRSFLSLSFRFQLKRSDRHPTLSLLCSLSLCRPPLVCHGTGRKSRHQSRAATLKSELHPFSAPQPTVWELQTITRVACP